VSNRHSRLLSSRVKETSPEANILYRWAEATVVYMTVNKQLCRFTTNSQTTVQIAAL
jgi:hypothetical protein